jgi:hypothetical protein
VLDGSEYADGAKSAVAGKIEFSASEPVDIAPGNIERAVTGEVQMVGSLVFGSTRARFATELKQEIHLIMHLHRGRASIQLSNNGRDRFGTCR